MLASLLSMVWALSAVMFHLSGFYCSGISAATADLIHEHGWD